MNLHIVLLHVVVVLLPKLYIVNMLLIIHQLTFGFNLQVSVQLRITVFRTSVTMNAWIKVIVLVRAEMLTAGSSFVFMSIELRHDNWMFCAW